MTTETITDEQYAEAQAIVEARRAQDEARVAAQREALVEPVTALVSTPEFKGMIAEVERLLAEYPDERMFFAMHLNALLSGGRNLAQAVGVDLALPAAEEPETPPEA